MLLRESQECPYLAGASEEVGMAAALVCNASIWEEQEDHGKFEAGPGTE